MPDDGVGGHAGATEDCGRRPDRRVAAGTGRPTNTITGSEVSRVRPPREVSGRGMRSSNLDVAGGRGAGEFEGRSVARSAVTSAPTLVDPRRSPGNRSSVGLCHVDLRCTYSPWRPPSFTLNANTKVGRTSAQYRRRAHRRGLRARSARAPARRHSRRLHQDGADPARRPLGVPPPGHRGHRFYEARRNCAPSAGIDVFEYDWSFLATRPGTQVLRRHCCGCCCAGRATCPTRSSASGGRPGSRC